MSKPILTPRQIAEKYIRATNPFCVIERRAVKQIQDEFVEYMEAFINAEIEKRKEQEANAVKIY